MNRLAISLMLLLACTTTTRAASVRTPENFIKRFLSCLKKPHITPCLVKKHAGRWDYYNFVFKSMALVGEKERNRALKNAIARYDRKGEASKFALIQSRLLLKFMAYKKCHAMEDKLIRGFRERGRKYLVRLKKSKYPPKEISFHTALIKTYFIQPQAVWKVLFKCKKRHAITVLRINNRWRWGNFEAEVPQGKKQP